VTLGEVESILVPQEVFEAPLVYVEPAVSYTPQIPTTQITPIVQLSDQVSE